ncbi:hypothetical protein XENORESO_012874 [Xenotaenia resolanae]|uniref:Uncharacterized protein n=1 Tax=Xenotaenia resolanae TaxID=208358 RepID=A0ABV0XAW6_9TELE
MNILSNKCFLACPKNMEKKTFSSISCSCLLVWEVSCEIFGIRSESGILGLLPVFQLSDVVFGFQGYLAARCLFCRLWSCLSFGSLHHSVSLSSEPKPRNTKELLIGFSGKKCVIST